MVLKKSTSVSEDVFFSTSCHYALLCTDPSDYISDLVTNCVAQFDRLLGRQIAGLLSSVDAAGLDVVDGYLGGWWAVLKPVKDPNKTRAKRAEGPNKTKSKPDFPPVAVFPSCPRPSLNRYKLCKRTRAKT